jgi:thiol-disulfide isomerase/thioredoxin
MSPTWTRRRWLATLPAFGNVPAVMAQGEPPRIDWPALVSVQGEPLQMLPGQGVPGVVVFWATWCAFCRRHNAHLDRLYREADPQRLRILSVATDRDPALVLRHLQATGWRFPVVMNEGRLMARFTPRRMVPMTCVLDAQGRLQQSIPGEMAEGDVMALAKLAVPAPR